MPSGAHEKRGPPKAHRGTHALALWMSLGNISEEGKARMPRQRHVLRWPRSLHGKASKAARAVPLSSPLTSCWKHLWGAEAQAFCLLRRGGCHGQERSPSTSLTVAGTRRMCVSSRHVPAEAAMISPGPRPPLAACSRFHTDEPRFPLGNRRMHAHLGRANITARFGGDCAHHHPGTVSVGKAFE